VIDEVDELILQHLVRDGRATHREVARTAGLSPNAAGARIGRLIDRGIITGFEATIDHGQLGRPLEVTMDVWLNHRPSDDGFLRLCAADDRIVDAVHITGPVDYRIRVRVASPEDLEDLLATMRAKADVNQTDSRIIMGRLPTVSASASTSASV